LENLFLRIDDFSPLPLVQPSSVAELGELVRQASADNQALYPVGGRTRLDFGMPPTRMGRAVDLRQLTQVIDYPARDMTVTVQAGITVARLQELLATENQRLPIDVPLADRATLGGILATNTSGPRRYGFGTLRDYVIGISAVNDEGQEIKAGGRVVKNVAGYDLCKLFIGSLGTLGIITQVTLKLKPRPDEHALITLACPPGRLEQLLDRLHDSRTRPVCLDLLNPAAAAYINRQTGLSLAPDAWHAVVGFEENFTAVTWQVRQLTTEIGVGCPLDARVDLPAEPLWRALVEFPAWPEAVLTFKANLLPHGVAAFCRKAVEIEAGLLLQAHAGNGIVIGHAAGDLTLVRAQALHTALTEEAGKTQGNLVVLRCPPAWKQTLPVWGTPRGDFALMRAVKDKVDPRRLFNPGRFVAGI
jgi:glycolate oxidase FAD binding subunit